MGTECKTKENSPTFGRMPTVNLMSPFHWQTWKQLDLQQNLSTLQNLRHPKQTTIFVLHHMYSAKSNSDYKHFSTTLNAILHPCQRYWVQEPIWSKTKLNKTFDSLRWKGLRLPQITVKLRIHGIQNLEYIVYIYHTQCLNTYYVYDTVSEYQYIT